MTGHHEEPTPAPGASVGLTLTPLLSRRNSIVTGTSVSLLIAVKGERVASDLTDPLADESRLVCDLLAS